MESTESKIRRLAERISEEEFKIFAGLLRRNLVAAGVDASTFDRILEATRLEFEARNAQDGIVDEVVRSEENRGIDTVGRVLVEYCFFRTAAVKMLWPEHSDQDLQARRQFTPDVIPRPMMRYFLISVRGTIDALDGFHSDSLLFGESRDEFRRLQMMLGDYLENFKGPFGSGESSIDWDEVYEDNRFKEVAVNLIDGMQAKLNEAGLEGYLERLEQYRRLDPERSGVNAMQRELTIDDARQIEETLNVAGKALKQMTH